MKKMYQRMMLLILTLSMSGVASAQIQRECQQMTPWLIGGISNCEINVTAKDQQGAGPNGFTYTWKVNGQTIVNNGTSNHFNYPVSAGGNYTVTVIFTIPNSVPLCTASGSASYTAPSSCGGNNDPTCPSNGIFVNNVECTSSGGGDASANWNVNASDVDFITWRYSIGPHSNVSLGTTQGNSNGLHQVNWNLPQANQPIPGTWDHYNLVVKARAYLVDGTVCQEYLKIITLDCPGGGGGNEKVGIIPNPTSSKFSVKSEKKAPITGLTVRNVYGRVVAYTSKDLSKEIDLSNQVAGIYFVEINFADGSTESEKVILEK